MGHAGQAWGDTGQIFLSHPHPHEGTARAGAGERPTAHALEDWVNNWVQIQTQPQRFRPAPSPQPWKLGHSEN